MIKLDIHTHSIASGHGSTDTISTMAKYANQIGLNLLGITDHGPATPGACKPSYFRSLSHAPRLRNGIELLYGVELNILDKQGNVDLDHDILSILDFAIASMHIQNLKPACLNENTQIYINAMKNPFVKLIGHCDDSKYPVDYNILVQAAIDNHVLLEINNSSLTPNGYRGNTRSNNQSLLKYCEKYNYPIVLSSDSHGYKSIGDVSHSKSLVDEVGFPKELILNYDVSRFKEFISCY